jgi:Uma2 family endonuclease
MPVALKIPEFLTIDAFLDWDAPSGQVWQLVDGIPQAMAPASPTHGQIQGEVAALIRNHLVETGSRCSMVVNPGVVPRVHSHLNMRIPDVGVTCTQTELGDRALRDPVLLIEILSPSSHSETWSNVWTYTTIPSVREILILHSTRIGAELLCRNQDGTWPERPQVIEAAADVALSSIGFSAPVAALYRATRLQPTG